MPQNAIPVDVLLNILEYVGQKDLATMCRVNKICCSCSQDVLYRDIFVRGSRVQHTLAQLTHLAKKVRSFGTRVYSDCLPMALRNMTSLRILKLPTTYETDVLDGCTFKLDSFECTYLAPYEESFKKFLSSQPSLKCVTLPIPTTSFSLEGKRSAEDIMNDWTCLPNLTRIDATFFWLPYLIPGRPLNEVIIAGSTPNKRSIDWSFFALSTTPIQKLTIDYSFLYSTPIHLLASFLPSLTHFTLIILDRYTFFKDEEFGLDIDDGIENMLAAFILLRDFTLQLIGDHDHSEKYLRYITKACHQAPHLETFTIDHGAYTIRCKRVNKNWVVCDKVKYPAP